MEDEQTIMKNLGIYVTTDAIHLGYLRADAIKNSPKNYITGTWIVADPSMEAVRGIVGYITSDPYTPISIIDVGN